MVSSGETGSISSDRLALLVRLSQDFNASLDPDEVLRRVMDEVIGVTRAERGFVMLFETEGEEAPEQAVMDISPSLQVRVAHGIDLGKIASEEFQVSRGIIERVLKDGQPLLTSDAQTDDRFSGRESVFLLRLRSVLCAPLRVKERILGIIYVDNRIQAGIFKPEDLELLTAIASNAAIAIENARLFRQVQGRVDTLHTLHQISKNITASLDLDRVLTISTESVKQLLNASAASIMTIEGKELVFQVAVGDRAALIKPFRFPLSQGIAGWVVSHNQAVIVADVQRDARFFNTVDEQSGFNTQCLVAAPLVVGDRPIGVIEAFNKPGGFSQTDLELLSTFASSAAFAIENARLYQVAQAKGRMERELQMAQRVQTGLLPKELPTLPGWEVAASWTPAHQVAGDYYDFFPLEHGHDRPLFAFVIADVADKGMPAALFMTLTRSTLRASAYAADSPAEVITHANVLISADSYNSMYVTLFYIQLDPASGEVKFVNAGHIPPFHFQPSAAQPLTLLRSASMPVGIDASIIYQQQSLTMQPGDMLILYTDGATDAFNESGESFGLERLKNVVSSLPGVTAAGMLAALQNAVRAHVSKAEPFDDLTLMVIKRI